jgi:archaellum component FlaC
MAIRLGSAYGKVELDASGVQKGVNTAKKSLNELNNTAKGVGGTFTRVGAWIKQNAEIIGRAGEVMQTAGKKMTQFITIPIIGFLALVTKKALDADTAIAKLAKDSIKKLNDQLVVLGEKFLPILIKIVDWLTGMIEKFNNASPAVQKLVIGLAALVALAGPMTSFAGTVSLAISMLSNLGVTFTSIIPAIVSFGTALWGALLPLLPILALIAAAVLLVYLVWKNWDQLKITVSQLGFIIKYELKKALDDVKKAASDFKDEWNRSLETWKDNFQQAQEINQKVQQIAIEAMSKMIVDFVLRASLKLTELRNWALNTWNSITSGFMNAWSAISNFFESVRNSIIAGIQAIQSAVDNLIASLQNIVLPDELTPGSPTPFETGLRGIADAMRQLSQQSIPELNRSFAMAQAARSPAYAMAGMGGGGSFQQVNHFASGLTERHAARMIEASQDAMLERITRLLENG